MTRSMPWVSAWLLLVATSFALADEPRVQFPDHIANCTRCHGANEDTPVLSIFATAHGILADSRTGMADQGCAACHGPSLDHARLPARAGGAEVEIAFHGERKAGTEIRNQTCMNCHAGAGMMHWQGSAHDFDGMACVDCHRVH